MFTPNRDGIWWRNDNDGTWEFQGHDVVALHLAMEDIAGWSHDQQLYLVHGERRWFICDGLNPLEAHRVSKLEAYLKKM